ncbi:MAG TPA: hypothetical protein VFA81_10390 [Burkholderiales bacterium]|nr:hypothetical protein [Burkholderiales bacterium]
MSEEELALYERLNLGEKNLLEFYRAQGFQVASVPWKDPAHLRVNPTALRDKQRQISRAALSSFDALQKPVVLHCSAGIDRSAPVAAYIYSQRCGS